MNKIYLLSLTFIFSCQSTDIENELIEGDGTQVIKSGSYVCNSEYTRNDYLYFTVTDNQISGEFYLPSEFQYPILADTSSWYTKNATFSGTYEIKDGFTIFGDISLEKFISNDDEIETDTTTISNTTLRFKQLKGDINSDFSIREIEQNPVDSTFTGYWIECYPDTNP